MPRVSISVEQNWNSVPGGTARSTNRLIDELLELDDVSVEGLHGRHRAQPTLALPEGLTSIAVPIPGKVLTQLWSRARVPSVDRWLDPGVDVVHGPAYTLPPTDRPSVVTIHDLAFVRHPEWFTNNGVGFFTRFLRHVLEDRPQVIVPSRHTADDCVRAGIDPTRIHLIPWGSDIEPVSPEAVAGVRARYGVADDAVVFVGTREPRKNLSTLLEAMARLPKRQLVVVGPDGWGDVDVSGALTLGQLPSDDVRALMAGAGLVAYPSHFEGFGLPVLEAMAQGAPVVTTEGTASAEVGGDAVVAVDTSDAEVLAAAIEETLSSSELRAELSDRGRRRAKGFSWRRTADATTSVYEGAIS
ncbi:MAG: glycosyltransferase family 4 protein [Acidimicrobiales bacterium]